MPRVTAVPEDAGAGAPTAAVVSAPAASAPPPALRRLHAVTGMAMGDKKLDPRRVLARIEASPAVLDTCSSAASLEPNGADGSWNMHLTVIDGRASITAQSAIEPAFESCLERAAHRLDLTGLGSGAMMLLLGLTDDP